MAYAACMTTDQHARIAAFRTLHETGCFTLPNPWDPGSAVWLAHAGFHALATTSAGFAFTQGLPDEVTAIPCTMMLEHIRAMCAATHLPVAADFQNGYGDTLEELAANVTACVHTGVAGLSIEDATGNPAAPLYDHDVAIARLRAARTAIDATGLPVVLTARCEAYLVNHPDAHRLVLDRLVAFAEAGADCLFAPKLPDLATVAEVVRAVAPRPLNVLVAAPGFTVAQLAERGVRRVSIGSALARVAWGAVIRSARQIAETGMFDSFADAASFAELDAVFGRRAR
jgi:2-methylisocitrate lyase-like PEP mutase family enzyme